MNNQKYKAKCRALFEKAKALGLELEFCPQTYDNNRLNCLWYGGQLAVIKISDKLSIELSICGDVYAEFVDRKGNKMACVKDKNNSGAFSKYVMPYLKNDRQLLAAIDSNRLYLGTIIGLSTMACLKSRNRTNCISLSISVSSAIIFLTMISWSQSIRLLTGIRTLRRKFLP